MKGLTKTRLKRLLSRFDVREDDDGDMVVAFPAEDDVPVSLDILFSITEEKTLLRLSSLPSTLRKIPVKRMGEAVLFCNSWNIENAVFESALFIPKFRSFGIKASLGLQHDVSDGEFYEAFVNFVHSAKAFYSKAAELFEWPSDYAHERR